MEKRTRIIFAFSAFSVTALGLAAAVGAVGENIGNRIFANDAVVWKHYSQALPGTIKGATNGVREYWVRCGGSGYQFTRPEGVTIEEGTDYDLASFEANDPRYIIPLTGEYRSAILANGNRYHGETPELAGDGWWYNGTLPEVGESKMMVWKNVNAEISDTTPQYYVDTLNVTKVINDWNTLKTTFHADNAEWTDTLDGYYVLGGDINITQNVNNKEYFTANYNNGFIGTLDGRGHTLDSSNVGTYNGGLFGLLNGATMKNVDFKVKLVNYSACVLASQANDSIFKNINIEILSTASDNSSVGRIVSKYSTDNLFEDMRISVAADQVLTNAFGANEVPSSTFINVTFQSDTKPTLWCSPDGGGTKITELQGLTYIPNGATVSSKRIDILASEETQSITLPSDVTGTVTEIKLLDRAGNEYVLGADPASITLPAAYVADAVHHGENVLMVTTSEGTFAVPTTVVTHYISTAQDFALVRGYQLGKKVYGYYAMDRDVVVNYDANTGIGATTGSGWSTTSNGFYGVFDGRGYVIKGNVFLASKGIFGTIQGDAVVENVNVYSDNYSGYANQVFGIGCMGEGSTKQIRFANIDVNIMNVGNNTARTDIMFTSGLNAIAFQNWNVTIRGEYPATSTVSLFPTNYLKSDTRLNHFVWNTPHADTLSLINGQTGTNPGLTINYTD